MPDMRKLKPYNKYKPVEYDYVSEVPEGWQLLPNIAVFEERIERGFVDEELLSVTIGRGVIRQTDVDIKKDSSNEDKSKYKLIKVGDIAYNRMRMWQGALGYSDYRGITSPAYVILKPKMDINQRFFHYMFRTSFYTNYSKRFSYGIVDDQLSLRYVDFKRMYTILPPLETQNEIVTYLDRKTKKTQEFIQRKERLIMLLEEEKRGIINIAISKGIKANSKLIDTGIEWLSQVPEHWDVKKLKYITTLIADGTHQTPVYTENGYPFLRITDIDGNRINWNEIRYISEAEHKTLTKTRKGKKGDILLSKNGTIGKVIEVTWDEEFSFFVSLCLIRFKKSVLPKYFSYFFKSDIVFDQLNEGSKTTSVTNLHLEKIKELRIAYPEFSEQENICNYLDIECGKIDQAISKAKLEIEKAKEFEESLITQVVTGQLKVPTLTPEKVLN
jgi:type I restriction enzyme S subunit